VFLHGPLREDRNTSFGKAPADRRGLELAARRDELPRHAGKIGRLLPRLDLGAIPALRLLDDLDAVAVGHV
jgi:hypothetical protein